MTSHGPKIQKKSVAGLCFNIFCHRFFIGKIIDGEVFWVLLGVDLTVIYRFVGSFLSCFGVKVLSCKFCEETEPGSNFHLIDDFLISVFKK